ncbi:MAG: T9SS type A sorting domain-containing protein [Crocinitomicaceae bacterium]
MKNILLILLAFISSTNWIYSQPNLILNGDFEALTNFNHNPNTSPINFFDLYVPNWYNGCNSATPDIFSTQNTDCLTKVPSNAWANNLPASIPGTKTYAGMWAGSEAIKCGISQTLLANQTYTLKMSVARNQGHWNCGSFVAGPSSNPLQVQATLRKSSNPCASSLVILTSQLITAGGWQIVNGTFTLTQAQAAQGYDRIEFKTSTVLSGAYFFMDDVTLLGPPPVASYSFTNPNQTAITLNSVYGPMPVTQICQTFPKTCVTIDGSASQYEDRYHIEITPWDLNGWAPSGPALFDNWVCIGCTVGPKNLCDLTNLNGSSFQPNVVYKVTLGVGIPWDDETHFIIIRPTSQIAPIANQTICSGNQATFNINTSNWPVQVFDGTTLVGTFNSNPIILNPNSTTTYTFVPSSKYECKEKRRATVTVETSPETRITGPNVFCLGDPLTFTGTLVAGFSLQHLWQIQKCDQNGNVLAGSVEYTTPWLYGSFPEIFTYTGSTTNMPANYLQPGYYRIKLVTLSAATNGCWGVTYKTIKILPTPIVNFQYPNDLDYLCNGESISFYVDQASFPVTVFEGTNPIAIFVSNPIIVSPTSTTTYTFTPDSDSKVICSTTQTIVVENCPKPCFEINDVQSQFEEESQYGPMIVNKICLPNEVIIDGSCSEYENGYHIRICEFDIGSWSFILPNLYSGWVSGSGNIPSSINLTSLVNSNGFNFSTGVVYLVAISTGSQWPGGPTWTSSLPQFFTLDYCTKSGAKINTTKGLVKTNSLSVYPNPTNGQLSVQLDKMDRGEMMVYSLDGKLLISQSFIDASRLKIDLSKFESGTYIIKINTSNNSFTKKIVKE